MGGVYRVDYVPQIFAKTQEGLELLVNLDKLTYAGIRRILRGRGVMHPCYSCEGDMVRNW